jgi:hypothetical protein
LRDADPATSLTTDAATLESLIGAARRNRPNRRRFFIGAGIAGVLAIGIAAPAAADVVRAFLAQTGEFGLPGFTENDESEYIDLLAPDAREYIMTVYPDYLPTPVAVDEHEFQLAVADKIVAAAVATSQQEGGVGVEQQRTGLVRTFEQFSYNEWIRAWLVADAAGDSAARDEATAVLADACSWPAFVATDGGGVIARMQTFADAAADGDRNGMQAAAQYNLVDGPGGWDGVDRDRWLTEHQP